MKNLEITLQVWKGEELVGWVRAEDLHDHDVVKVWVEPPHRGVGLGRRAIEYAKVAASALWRRKWRGRCSCSLHLRKNDAPWKHLKFCSKWAPRRYM